MKEDFDKNIPIKNWALEDRPREKLLLKGRNVLSEAELLGILLGSGTRSQSAVALAQHLLLEADNNLNTLAKWSIQDFTKFNGIGEAKAVNIVSALELGKRRKKYDQNEQQKLTTPDIVYDFLKGDLEDLQNEEFWIVLLKRNKSVIRKIKISSGGVSATVVDSRIIFKYAVQELASALILAHNHPSGNLEPSEEDLKLTQKICDAGSLFGIEVPDHLIIGQSGYFSFKANNLI